MPIYQVDIEKTVVAESFTNVYFVSSPTLQTATQDALAVVGFEKAITLDIAQFVRMRVRTAIEGDEVYSLTPLSGAGNRGTTTNPLALFNTLNVLLGAAAGRPSRKYYRAALMEQDVNFNTIDTFFMPPITALGAALLVDITLNGSTLVDLNGDAITSIVAQSKIGMRQLRRGSRRRTQPILT
jgi:hypothetical protein